MVDSVKLDKDKLLPERQQYSYQLKTYLENKYSSANRTCFIYFETNKEKLEKSMIGSTVSVAVTYIFVCVCWVFFRAPDFQIAMDVLTKMFIWTNGITQIFSWSIFGIIGVAICTLLAYVKAKSNNQTHINGYYAILDLTKTFHLFLFFLTIMLTICLAYTNANPFIYFQF